MVDGDSKASDDEMYFSIASDRDMSHGFSNAFLPALISALIRSASLADEAVIER